MSRLLVVVDMQKDFVDGALGSKEAQAIVPHVIDKIKAYQEASGHPLCQGNAWLGTGRRA